VPYQATTAKDGGSVWGSVTNGKIAPPSAILAMREGGRGAVAAKAVPAGAAKRAAAPAVAKPQSATEPAAPPKQAVASKEGKVGTAHEHVEARASGSNGPNWECPSCQAVVYGRRAVCFKCKTAKPANATAVSAAAVPAAAASARVSGAGAAAGGGGGGASATSGGNGTHLYPRKPKDGDVRDGDWVCSGCKGHNFASKIACFTCRTPRPPGYVIDTPDAADGEAAKADRKPGDWTCPKCTENVFAKRNRCYKCSTSKPKSTSGGAEGV